MTNEQKKTVVKFVFGAATSLIIGQLIKLERKMEERIDQEVDNYFDTPAVEA
ncbi:hypothetical protein SEA_ROSAASANTEWAA_33 [Streptomyces phage RosaAsantewaa]|nr:hypothetical protein SEA_ROSAASANTEWAA_33 [Streptomyces phage RosaAsantewaa]